MKTSFLTIALLGTCFGAVALTTIPASAVSHRHPHHHHEVARQATPMDAPAADPLSSYSSVMVFGVESLGGSRVRHWTEPKWNSSATVQDAIRRAATLVQPSSATT